jgi:hypothetical protein
MNKLEQLLEEVVKGSTIHCDDSLLVFTKSNKPHYINIIFSKHKHEPFYVIEYYLNSTNHSYNIEPLKFEIPISHIYDFVKKHLNKNEHHLLDCPKGLYFLSPNIYYNELLKFTENNQHFSSIFLSASLQVELQNNSNQVKKMKV